MQGTLAFLGSDLRRRRKPVYKPTKAGGGGPLKVLRWQAPTLLNPHFASAPRIRLPRASSTSRWPAGTPKATSWPLLAAEVPTRKNGGLSDDGTTVTWNLSRA